MSSMAGRSQLDSVQWLRSGSQELSRAGCILVVQWGENIHVLFFVSSFVLIQYLPPETLMSTAHTSARVDT